MFHHPSMFEMLLTHDEVTKLKKWYKVLNIREENIYWNNCESNHHNGSHDYLRRNHRSLFIARLSCAAAWILALILSIPFMMLRKTNTDDGKKRCLFYKFDEEPMPTLSIIRFVFGFLVPLICITTCYGFIARKLGRRHFHSGRAFRIMLAVIVTFFLCWLPYHIVHLVIMYGEKSSSLVALAVDPLTVSLAYFNSCLNPILYVFMGQDFKSTVKLSLRHVFERVFSEEGTQMARTTSSGAKVL
ncbi:C3a anaphylatoxin chemotactic receptor-like [Carassius gibelio]|uniref:C3a anaphylatoxin chemotactic receptor-like n=1 Tax=Carassius gibelio TaxID=101364 RepID=UPI002277F3CE|nr:C3a anaphylatoxin chemotactic receptor-like [Carassius gibelio]